jgi:dihydrofolate reductase / thymidylate synthase
MLSMIVCVDSKFGIAKEDTIPWYISDDLKHFKTITMNKDIIVGRKTNDTLPNLPGRTIHVATNNNLTDLLEKLKEKDVVIIGGAQIYKEMMDKCDEIHLTVIEKDYKCDLFFPKIPETYKLVEYSDRKYNEKENCWYRFYKYTYEPGYKSGEREYINICRNILDKGSIKEDRTGTGTLSLFGNQLSFDISKYTPLLTTKRVAWKSCINELLWFLRGSTNVKELQDVGCNIWNGNSSMEYKRNNGLGHLLPEDTGPIYGFNWKHFGAEYKNCYTDYTGKGFDQIEYIINEIKTNPSSRRLVLSGWNPCVMNEGVLPSCHSLCQFYVSDDKLSCQMYQRSADFFLGVPFNIFSYGVLTQIIAKKTGLKPDKLIIVFGDTHLYKDHLSQTEKQISRQILTKPILNLDDSIIDKDFKDMTINDFELVGYFPHPSIKGIMSI